VAAGLTDPRKEAEHRQWQHSLYRTNDLDFRIPQVSCRVAAGLTDPRKEAEHKRFIPRRIDGKENGFLMLRCGEAAL
jgi:hypothetical protein